MTLSTEKADMIKIGAIVLDAEGRMLIARSRGKSMWYFVGGKIHEGESHEECLCREIEEELGVCVAGKPRFYMQSPIEPAAGDPLGRTVQIFAYVTELAAPPAPSSEIEELHWLTAAEYQNGDLELGSVLRDYTVPQLVADGLMR
jgi:8-oxo-dGTP diphosphatase